MHPVRPLDYDTAAQLINFAGRHTHSEDAPTVARQQLEGAVAIHNILAKRKFAYLADEVGMGKTYVALGAVALLRYFHPSLRVLYIAPRENIQHKWQHEQDNFAHEKWRISDLRVRTLEGHPVDRGVVCENLADWARHAAREPNRDAFLRMPSFSFGLRDKKDDPQGWANKRRELLDIAPCLDARDIPLKHADKDRFKDDYALAVNRLLPHYDLVVFDEAHNLKHGRDGPSARNRLIERVLGTHPEDGDGAVRRFDRVLMLSATPLESDFAELWRQLDLFGFGESARELIDDDRTDEQKRDKASEFVVRRLTQLEVAGKRYTRNMYRREWRAGGMARHDEPLEIPSERQRLVVALVQKKVAEVLRDERFNASFQIGMLASFESFLETAEVRARWNRARGGNGRRGNGAIHEGDDRDDPDQPNGAFDQPDQTEDPTERAGADVSALNRLARSYRRKFGEPLPHPKMDAVVDNLADSLERGDKTLVFVRRVKSVYELKDKLSRAYDKVLYERLFRELPEPVHGELQAAWDQYEDERRRSGIDQDEPMRAGPASNDGVEPEGGLGAELDGNSGGRSTFFAWFFRGEGPGDLLSGAAFQRKRLSAEGSSYSTFFEDNYVWDLVGQPGDVLTALAEELDRDREDVRHELQGRAYAVLAESVRQKQPRLRIYRAYQDVALHMLKEGARDGLSKQAAALLRLREWRKEPPAPRPAPAGFSDAAQYLNLRTLFTELRRRPELRRQLWPEPELSGEPWDTHFRERETRRELLSAVARLGQPFIDLWTLAIQQIGSLRLGRANEAGERADELIDLWLDRLERQRAELAGEGQGEDQLASVSRKVGPGLNAYRELREVGSNHGLLMSVNFPEAKDKPFRELARYFGSALSRQVPVGGMVGGVNRTSVRQFRMPGYPIVMITTDVLQEGEDLHTFCARAVHYGITWTPSAMEQRTGRVDRYRSLTHRRLEGRAEVPQGADLLQVHYPYLADTVERLQVDRVFRRMNEFVRLIHHGHKQSHADPRIHMPTAFVQGVENIAPIDAPLESAFPVKDAHLEGAAADLGTPGARVERQLQRLQELCEGLGRRVDVTWEGDPIQSVRFGTVYVDGGTLVRAGGHRGEARQQPFLIRLRTSETGRVLIHAMSPVTEVNADDAPDRAVELVDLQSQVTEGVRVCEVPGDPDPLVTVEDDILMHTHGTTIAELVDLAERVTTVADWVEQHLAPNQDASYADFQRQLQREARRGRNPESAGRRRRRGRSRRHR